MTKDPWDPWDSLIGASYGLSADLSAYVARLEQERQRVEDERACEALENEGGLGPAWSEAYSHETHCSIALHHGNGRRQYLRVHGVPSALLDLAVRGAAGEDIRAYATRILDELQAQVP